LPRDCPDTEARGGTTSHPTSSRAAQPNSLTSDFTPVTRVTDISPHPRQGHFTRDFTTPASGTFHPGFHHTRVREHSAGRRARRRKHTSRRVRCVSPERAERSRAVAFNRSLWVSRVHSRDILLSSSEALRSFTRSLARSDIPFRAHKCWQSCPETPREAPASSAALSSLDAAGKRSSHLRCRCGSRQSDVAARETSDEPTKRQRIWSMGEIGGVGWGVGRSVSQRERSCVEPQRPPSASHTSGAAIHESTRR